MQIPKNARKQKLHEKHCQYPGCNKFFFGISISKYCHEHRKEKYKIRQDRGRYIPSPKDHRIIEDKVIKVERTVVTCDCCKEPFEIKLYPNQKVYPKWCNLHANGHQRKRYKENHNGQMDNIGRKKSYTRNNVKNLRTQIFNTKKNQSTYGNTNTVFINPLNSLKFVLNKLKKDKIYLNKIKYDILWNIN